MKRRSCPVVQHPPVLIKRYGGERLYAPAQRRYVSIDDLRAWRRLGIAFSVVDAETGAEVTVPA